MPAPKVTQLKLKQKSRLLVIAFSDGTSGEVSCEFLRVHSPSAEVQGHGTPVLVTNKKQVNISNIEAVGHYGVKLVFDDGHDTGIYSWEVLHHLVSHHQSLWQSYLERLTNEKGSREAIIPMVVKYRP
ncbi:DUF971 domain-containing protein [Shewanella sp. 202IG2-18]|uniref:gamma-butyrobetaine hydroxylase-like domain-containing protein n=1 Tax=Parashewanella hymeniacidonis TaxID=2807618 RepID=UPI00196122B6|nr:gamma-butyrobetaine hydroxylase-like domain-containing protein [Parashewanella hymeniacidonis]MBM7074167.1 DUF971 domain-containing protein [Parashewanella hymeniacidonis]